MEGKTNRPPRKSNAVRTAQRLIVGCCCVILLLGLSACASVSGPLCRSPSGVDALIERPRISYLVLGEYHGTQEMPAVAGEIACAAATRSERVVLALEISSSEDAVIQALLNDEAGPDQIIQQSRFWQRVRDGRSSAAMMQLLLRIRELRQQGLRIDVVAADAPYEIPDERRADIINRFRFLIPDGADPNRSFRDLYMAASMIDEANRPSTRIVVLLVGNNHALREPFERRFLNPSTGAVTNHLSVPVAAALPREETLSVLLTHGGGSAFVMSSSTTTGNRSVTPSETCTQRLLQVYSPTICGNVEEQRYDMHLYVGEIHSSPPAADEHH